MECGYTSSSYFNDIGAVSNPHRKVDRLGLVADELDNIKSAYYASDRKKYLTIRAYENLGKCVAVSLLDLYSANQFSRLPNSSAKTLEELRSSIRESLGRANKDYKTYAQRIQPPQTQLRKVEKLASPAFSLAKSVPKPLVLSLFDKKVISSKHIATQKQSETKRRRTLPKMRNLNS